MSVLRLGELHTEFAMIRAIGSYISGSGIDMAWLKAGWFKENTFLLDIPRECLSCAEEILLLVREMQSIDFNVVREAFGVLEILSTDTGSIIHTQIIHFEA